jgi:alpha-tubulin suppressor-like RCC1 family protein
MTQSDATVTWSSVYAGADTSFAIRSNGALYGCGLQTNGALGNGGTGNLGTFTQIGSDTDWQKISVHPLTTANFLNLGIARKGGKIWVTGTNTGGGLGLLSQTTVTTWTKLSDITVSDISYKNYGHTLVII